MARDFTGGMKLIDGEWRVRVSEYDVQGVRQRPWYGLGTADEQQAARKRDRLLPEIKAKNEAMLRGGSNVLAPSTAPKFESYARAWQIARKVEGIAFAESEIIYLEKYIFPTDVGTEEQPARFGDLLLGDIRPRHVKIVLERTRGLGKAKQTVQHVRATLGRVLRKAVEDELVGENVVTKVSAPKMREVKRKRVILADDEVMAFFGCERVELEIRVMGLVARCEGGMRTRDVTAWDWTMIDRARFATCIVPRTKTGAPQELDVPEILQAPLRRWWVSQGSPSVGPVFPVTKGPRKGDARRERGVSFAKRLRRALLDAGIKRHICEAAPLAPGRRKRSACCPVFATDPLYAETEWSRPVDFHSFRRAYSTGLARAGVNAQQAMILAGHADPRAHGRYIMTTPEMQRIPAAALPRSAAFNGISMGSGSERPRHDSKILNESGAGHEIRTRDPQLGKLMLYQLS